MTIDRHLLAAAADWHAQLAGEDPDFDGFTTWLEASPGHARAYDRVIELDDALGQHRDAIAASLPADDLAANDLAANAFTDATDYAPTAQPAATRRRFVIAAMLALVALPASLWLTTLRSVVQSSAPGERLEFALDSRTSIDLDGNSAISHRKGHTDTVKLAHGAALFTVRHDPAKRFAVVAGDVEIVDLGTRFEVVRTPGHISVAVAQGSVQLHWPKSPELKLVAGQRADFAQDHVVVSAIEPASVASWRDGRLIYRNAPLSQVAQEVSRYTALPVIVDPAIANRPFSGVLTIGDGSALDTNLADFMGLARRRDSTAIHLGARP